METTCPSSHSQSEPDLGELIFGPEVSKRLAFAEAEKAEKYRKAAASAGRYLGKGTSRLVFEAQCPFFENAVLKVPRHNEGVADNKKEHKRFHGPGYGFPMAPCEITDLGTLYMVRVNPVPPKNYSSLPGWAQSVDGGQVGWLEGELLAFDYGSYIPGL